MYISKLESIILKRYRENYKTFLKTDKNKSNYESTPPLQSIMSVQLNINLSKNFV